MSIPLVNRQEHYLWLKVGRPEVRQDEKQREIKSNHVIWRLHTGIQTLVPHLLGDLKDSPCRTNKVTIKERPQILMA